MEYIAHIKKSESGEFVTPHFLDEHLLKTAELAKRFAEPFEASDWAYLAGLWHDLGKYSCKFQNYIRNASGYSDDALEEHLGNVKPGRVDHSTAGAQWA